MRWILTVFLLIVLPNCGEIPAMDLPTGEAKTEVELNAVLAEDLDVASVMAAPTETYQWPPYKDSFTCSQKVYDAAQKFYVEHPDQFPNNRYVVIIDFAKISSTRRLMLMDLKTGKIEKYLVTHGQGSDPDNDGYAQKFSNTPESKMSSLGAYRTLTTYIGGNGRSLRLDGLEDTNSKALSRLIVMHGSNYVKEASRRVGRSWGCPAMDHAVVQSVIDRVRGGALLYIGR